MTTQAVLKIFIPNQGFVKQGKFCFINNKPCFVANMTEAKVFRNYAGYAISKRVLEKLPRGIQIIYKRIDQQQYFITNRSTIEKKGILISYGGHSQYVLPIKIWKIKHGVLENEPKDLPVINLDSWVKEEKVVVCKDGWMRLKEEFNQKYA
jgi:hypothetical protein